jgi:hypothetical protein
MLRASDGRVVIPNPVAQVTADLEVVDGVQVKRA